MGSDPRSVGMSRAYNQGKERTVNTDAIYAAIVADRELEAAADNTTEALARHRWHWTLDESNPDAISITAFAERLGRSQNVVFSHAHGYSLKAINPDMSLPEAIARASTGAQQTELFEAVAAATGKTFQNVRKNNTPLARAVRIAATERAERKGTTISEELAQAAKAVWAAKQADEKEKKARRAGKSSQLLALEGHLSSAQLSLKYALRDTDPDLLDDESREYLHTVIARLRTMLDLVDLKATDRTETDWDAELAKLGEQS
jgi:hypothetical protein